MSRRRRPTVRFLNNPLATLARWAARRYKLGRFDIRIVERVDKRGARGCTTFYVSRRPLVELVASLPYNKMLAVLGHELAHILTWREHGPHQHGKRWREAFDRIGNDWQRYARRMNGGVREDARRGKTRGGDRDTGRADSLPRRKQGGR